MLRAKFAAAFVVLVLVFAACASDSTGDSPSTRPTQATTTPSPGSSPRVFADMAYATQSPLEVLDLGVPAGKGPFPLVVFVHGGAFVTGDKSEAAFAPYAQTVLDRGYAVATVNYRLAPQDPFPAAVQDVKAAVRWLRANAGRFGLDPERFAAWGESAGGYLVAMLGTTAGLAGFDDPALGNAGVSSDVQAVVDWYGPTDLMAMDRQLRTQAGCESDFARHDIASSGESQFLGARVSTVPRLARTASPLSYIEPGRPVPPFLVEHGDRDCVVPYRQSQTLAAALRRLNGPSGVDMRIVHGFGHWAEFDIAGQVPVVLNFLDRVLPA
jgi:acetyl esterase/lipase